MCHQWLYSQPSCATGPLGTPAPCTHFFQTSFVHEYLPPCIKCISYLNLGPLFNFCYHSCGPGLWGLQNKQWETRQYLWSTESWMFQLLDTEGETLGKVPCCKSYYFCWNISSHIRCPCIRNIQTLVDSLSTFKVSCSSFVFKKGLDVTRSGDMCPL